MKRYLAILLVLLIASGHTPFILASPGDPMGQSPSVQPDGASPFNTSLSGDERRKINFRADFMDLSGTPADPAGGGTDANASVPTVATQPDPGNPGTDTTPAGGMVPGKQLNIPYSAIAQVLSQDSGQSVTITSNGKGPETLNVNGQAIGTISEIGNRILITPGSNFTPQDDLAIIEGLNKAGFTVGTNGDGQIVATLQIQRAAPSGSTVPNADQFHQSEAQINSGADGTAAPAASGTDPAPTAGSSTTQAPAQATAPSQEQTNQQVLDGIVSAPATDLLSNDALQVAYSVKSAAPLQPQGSPAPQGQPQSPMSNFTFTQNGQTYAGVRFQDGNYTVSVVGQPPDKKDSDTASFIAALLSDPNSAVSITDGTDQVQLNGPAYSIVSANGQVSALFQAGSGKAAASNTPNSSQSPAAPGQITLSLDNLGADPSDAGIIQAMQSAAPNVTVSANGASLSLADYGKDSVATAAQVLAAALAVDPNATITTTDRNEKQSTVSLSGYTGATADSNSPLLNQATPGYGQGPIGTASDPYDQGPGTMRAQLAPLTQALMAAANLAKGTPLGDSFTALAAGLGAASQGDIKDSLVQELASQAYALLDPANFKLSSGANGGLTLTYTSSDGKTTASSDAGNWLGTGALNSAFNDPAVQGLLATQNGTFLTGAGGIPVSGDFINTPPTFTDASEAYAIQNEIAPSGQASSDAIRSYEQSAAPVSQFQDVVNQLSALLQPMAQAAPADPVKPLGMGTQGEIAANNTAIRNQDAAQLLSDLGTYQNELSKGTQGLLPPQAAYTQFIEAASKLLSGGFDSGYQSIAQPVGGMLDYPIYSAAYAESLGASASSLTQFASQLQTYTSAVANGQKGDTSFLANATNTLTPPSNQQVSVVGQVSTLNNTSYTQVLPAQGASASDPGTLSAVVPALVGELNAAAANGNTLAGNVASLLGASPSATLVGQALALLDPGHYALGYNNDLFFSNKGSVMSIPLTDTLAIPITDPATGKTLSAGAALSPVQNPNAASANSLVGPNNTLIKGTSITTDSGQVINLTAGMSLNDVINALMQPNTSRQAALAGDIGAMQGMSYSNAAQYAMSLGFSAAPGSPISQSNIYLATVAQIQKQNPDWAPQDVATAALESVPGVFTLFSAGTEQPPNPSQFIPKSGVTQYTMASDIASLIQISQQNGYGWSPDLIGKAVTNAWLSQTGQY